MPCNQTVYNRSSRGPKGRRHRRLSSLNTLWRRALAPRLLCGGKVAKRLSAPPALHRSAEEDLQAMAIGPGGQPAAFVQQLRRHAISHEIGGRHRLEVGVPGKKAVDDVLVLFGLAGTRRVDQASTAEPPTKRPLAIIRPCLAAACRMSSGDRRQRMSTSRRSVPRPVQGASSSTRSKTAGNGAPRSRSNCITCVRSSPAVPRISRSSATRRLLTSLATSRPPVHDAGGQRERLAARRGARVEGSRSRARAHQQRDELRGFVLHEKHPGGDSEVRSGWPSRTINPSGAYRVAVVSTPPASQPPGELIVASCAVVFARSVERRLALLKSTHVGRGVRAEAVDPALDQPARMRPGYGQILDAARRRGISPIGDDGCGSSSRFRVRASCRSTPLTKPAALVLRARLRQRHRVVHRCGRRHARREREAGRG